MLLLSWVTFCLRAFVAALFITYACNKLLNLSNFAATIRRHRLIPDSLSGIAATILSLLELALGLLFLFNIFPLVVGLTIDILLVGFSGILLRAHFTPDLNIQGCGCSGANNWKTPIRNALSRNALLISAIVVTMIVAGMHKNTSLSLSPLIEGILLVCILAGILCTQSNLFSSLWNGLNTEELSQKGEISTVTGGGRRSFIKWGIAGLIGLSTFLSMAPIASAITVSPCESGAGCSCNRTSTEYDKCYTGVAVSPIYISYEWRCCDSTDRGCSYISIQTTRTVQCTGC
jgi:uncharacterized membrane protein YphA (DoxX/SURF4 family)